MNNHIPHSCESFIQEQLRRWDLAKMIGRRFGRGPSKMSAPVTPSILSVHYRPDNDAPSVAEFAYAAGRIAHFLANRTRGALDERQVNFRGNSMSFIEDFEALDARRTAAGPANQPSVDWSAHGESFMTRRQFGSMSRLPVVLHVQTPHALAESNFGRALVDRAQVRQASSKAGSPGRAPFLP